jgi:uncharacterized membrane protein (DUF441 family)
VVSTGRRDAGPAIRLVGLAIGLVLIAAACLLPWTTGRTDDDRSVVDLLADAPWVAALMGAAVAALGTAFGLLVTDRRPRLARRLGLAAVPLVGLAVALTPRPVARVLGATRDGQMFEFDDPTRLGWAVLVAAAGVVAAVAALALPARRSTTTGPPLP